MSAFSHSLDSEWLKVFSSECFKSIRLWAEMESETFQFEERGCLLEVAEPQLLWNCFSPVLDVFIKRRLVCAHFQIHSGLFYLLCKVSQRQNKEPKREGTAHDCFWEVVVTNYCRESMNFGVWQFGLETQLGHVYTCMALAIPTDLPSVNFLLCKMVIQIPTSYVWKLNKECCRDAVYNRSFHRGNCLFKPLFI